VLSDGRIQNRYEITTHNKTQNTIRYKIGILGLQNAELDSGLNIIHSLKAEQSTVIQAKVKQHVRDARDSRQSFTFRLDIIEGEEADVKKVRTTFYIPESLYGEH